MPVFASSETASPSVPIGFIGLGSMGAPMARRLAGFGFPLVVYDINPRAVQSVVECGARAAASPKAIASEATLVFTSLPSLAALREVALGAEGLRAGSAVKTYVDLSTSDSQFAREISVALETTGIAMVDSPVVGTPDMAADGTLGIACSGPPAAFRRAEPILQKLGNPVVYVGDRAGQAQTMKLLNNLLSQTGMVASCEAFILGVKAGLDPEIMLEIINAGEASSHATRKRFPRFILPRSFNAGVHMAITFKDISLCMKEAEALGVPMWLGQTVRQTWGYAISQGAADKDGTTLITYLEPWAGVEVRSRAGKKSKAQISRDAAATRTRDNLVLLCEERMRPTLAYRLRQGGWLVAGGRGAATSAPQRCVPGKGGTSRTAHPSCTLVSVPRRGTAREFVSSWQRAHRTKRVTMLLNLCPTASIEAAALHAALARQGIDYIDAPLAGTVHDAKQGTLSVIVSGTQAAFKRAKPVLHSVADCVFYAGKRAGSAQVMHQINGSLSSILYAISCEAFVAGAKAGLTPEMMSKVMSIDTGCNAASARIIPDQVATRRFAHGKTIADSCRDLTLMTDEARRRGITMWVSDKTRQLYALAAQLGKPQEDMTRLIVHYEKWANVEVRAVGAPKRPARSPAP